MNDDAKYAMLGRFIKECVEMCHEAGLNDESTPDQHINAYIASWEKQQNRIAELEREVQRLKNNNRTLSHHVLCSMTDEPFEDGGRWEQYGHHSKRTDSTAK